MKAVIVDPLCALLAATGLRWAEYCGHPTNYRGPLAIVAGQVLSRSGLALCVVEIGACVRPADGEGWAWVWCRMKPIPRPCTVSGGVGLYDVPLTMPRGPWVLNPRPDSLTPLLDTALASLGQTTHYPRRKENAA